MNLPAGKGVLFDLDAIDCFFADGDGIGGVEVYMKNINSDSDCIENCQGDPQFNGVTIPKTNGQVKCKWGNTLNKKTIQ